MGYGGDRVGEYFSVRVSNIDKKHALKYSSSYQGKGRSYQALNISLCIKSNNCPNELSF